MKSNLKFIKFTGVILISVFVNLNSEAQNVRPKAYFEGTEVTAYESGFKPAILRVRRSDNRGKLKVMFRLKTIALPGKDFDELPECLIFNDGESESSLVIRPLADYNFHRKDKKLQIILLKNTFYDLGQDSVANVSVIQDPTPKSLPDDSTFFSKINVDLPAFSTIRSAVTRGDYTQARKALASYYRERLKPVYPYSRREPDKTTLENVLNNTYHVTGLTYNFGKGKYPGIDWSYSVDGNPNWSWEINRFNWWQDLAQAYLDDPQTGKIYAERIFNELADWLHTSPLDVTIVNQLTPGNRWRNLESGIRLESNWTQTFYLLKNSRLLSDSLMIDWLKAFYMHCRFLESSAELGTNRGVTEASALYTGGSFFPEFKEAEGWQKLAIERIENIIKNEVNSDGTFKEYSPSYHEGSVAVYRRTIEFARLNNLTLSPLIFKATEKLLNYLLIVSEPMYTIPQMNDSYRFKINAQMREGFKLFPSRKDFQYIATNRNKGYSPKITSYLFTDAGQAVMRSGWKADDNYLLMDAGPFGISHGHEDKLSISVDGYGVRHIIDGGQYNYEDTNPYRMFSYSTLAKSAPVIDGLSQNRRAVPALYKKKEPVNWFSSPKYDYVSASFGMDSLERWGKELSSPAITTRHIFYLKPDIWVVIDAVSSSDHEAHVYSGLFQCNDDSVDIDSNNKRVLIQLKPGEYDPFNRTINTTLQPSMTITPLFIPGMRLSVAKGQTEPEIAGWQFEKSTSWKKQAIPRVRYDVKYTGDLRVAYVLAASPANKRIKKPQVSLLPVNSGTYGVHVQNGVTTNEMLLIALDGNKCEWRGKTYHAPALIVTLRNGNETVAELKSAEPSSK